MKLCGLIAAELGVMKNISKIIYSSSIAFVSAIFSVIAMPAIAMGLSPLEAGALAARTADQPLNLFGASGVFNVISNTAMFLVGALSVVMLIFGGFKYIISGGDSTKITAAKNTILYAIVGVVVALLAYAAIDFVTSALVTNGSGSSFPGTNI